MNQGLQGFLTVALPIMVTLVATIWISSWSQNKRFDDLRNDLKSRYDDLRTEMHSGFDGLRGEMNRRFDEVTTRLDRIERKLDNHDERIVRVEERTALIHR